MDYNMQDFQRESKASSTTRNTGHSKAVRAAPITRHCTYCSNTINQHMNRSLLDIARSGDNKRLLH